MLVGVIGLGYVGLPGVVAFAESGQDVIAWGIDAGQAAAVAGSESYIEDISSERLQRALPRIQPTRNHHVPILEELDLQSGTDFNVAFSPAGSSPGRTDYTRRSTPPQPRRRARTSTSCWTGRNCR